MLDSPHPHDHNNPPPLRDILAEKYTGFATDAEAIAARANVAPAEIDGQDTLGVVADIVKEAKDLARRVDQTRSVEKEPHLTASREVDAFFKTFIERMDRVAKGLSARIDAYQRRRYEEEQRRLREEAERQRQEAARREAEARAAEEANRPKSADLAISEAVEAEDRAAELEARALHTTAADVARTRTDGGTAVTAQTVWTFTIEDYAAIDLNLLRPYLKREDIEKALRAHVRTNRDQAPIPGVKFHQDIKSRIG